MLSLAALPESLGALTGLQQLDLRSCKSLAALPESLGALTGLQQLTSAGAITTALPESLGALTGLQQLDLERVHITGRAARVAGRADRAAAAGPQRLQVTGSAARVAGRADRAAGASVLLVHKAARGRGARVTDFAVHACVCTLPIRVLLVERRRQCRLMAALPAGRSAIALALHNAY